MNRKNFKIIFSIGIIILGAIVVGINIYLSQRKKQLVSSVVLNAKVESSLSSPSTSSPITTVLESSTPKGNAAILTPTTNTSASLISKMNLTFDDEFNTLSLYTDSKGNTTCNSGGKGTWQTVYFFCSRTIPSNNEAEIYIDQSFLNWMNSKEKIPVVRSLPFAVNNGILTITVKPTDPAIQAVAGFAKYSSGLLTTEYSFSQTYGYFEIRAKLPAGRGLWPAFWLLPVDKSWPPEIDFLETFGAPSITGEGPSTSIHYASHTTDTAKSCGAWYPVGVDVTKDFHTYGVDWEPTGITYYFDGKPYVTCKPNPQANKPFYILLNVAVGGQGSWPGTPDSSNVWPAQMQVDYVRAYQKK